VFVVKLNHILYKKEPWIMQYGSEREFPITELSAPFRLRASIISK